MRDDRVFQSTRILGMVIVPFLLVAFALLYFFPDDTASYFAWDVQPTITPLVMGAGYIAGAYFFLRVARERLWHRIQVGFLPVTAFTLFMAIGTFAHLDRFDTQHVAFWIWVGLYVTTPVLVPLAWWRNRATDPRTPEPGEPPLPPHVRTALLVVGAVQSLVALVLLLSPSHDDRALAVAAHAADRADARRLVRAARRDRADDGDRRALERDPHHAREPADRPRADPARHRARLGATIDTSNALAYVFVGGLAVLFAALLALECLDAGSLARWPRSASKWTIPAGRTSRSPRVRSATPCSSTSSRTPAASPRSSRSSCTSTSTAA